MNNPENLAVLRAVVQARIAYLEAFRALMEGGKFPTGRTAPIEELIDVFALSGVSVEAAHFDAVQQVAYNIE